MIPKEPFIINLKRPLEEITNCERPQKRQKTVNSSRLGKVSELTSETVDADLINLFENLQINPICQKRKRESVEEAQKRRKIHHLNPICLKRKRETVETPQKRQKQDHLIPMCQWPDNPECTIVFAHRLIEGNSQEQLKIVYNKLTPIIEKYIEGTKREEVDELVYLYFQFLVVTKGFPCAISTAAPAVIKAILEAQYSGLDISLKLLFAIYKAEISTEITLWQFLDDFHRNDGITLSKLCNTSFKSLVQDILKNIPSLTIKKF